MAGGRVSLGAVVLAAGAGRRLGGVAKALLTVDGVGFLARIVASAGHVGVAAADVVVVVGPPFTAEVTAAATALGARVVINPAPARGMASSVARGFAALAAHVDAAFLWPVDHPQVAVATLAQLIARGEGAPRYRDRGGHPPLVGRRWFAALAAAEAHPDGARGVLRGRLAAVPVDDPGVVRDVDTPADLAEAACAG
ncbi:MAG: NTP transferase domain-containing protein [Kofleriaceae bacterium]